MLKFINTIFEYSICSLCMGIVLFGAYSVFILIAS